MASLVPGLPAADRERPEVMLIMPESGAATDALPRRLPRRAGDRPAFAWRVIRWCCVLAALSWVGAEAYDVFLGPNFHMIVPGRVFRSAQLSATALEQKLRAKGIRTVVNLRGTCDPSPWYLDESRVTNRLNVCQEDISFSAGHLPPVSEVRRLVEVLDRTDYPILLHCRRGADRTGMTAAIVLLLQTDANLSQARRQLGLRYGHIAIGRPANLDWFLDLYDEWLQTKGWSHSPAVFRHWLVEDYCPGECRCEIRPLEAPNPIVSGQPFALRMRFRNTSVRPWRLRAGSNAGIHGCYFLWDPQGNFLYSARAGLMDAEVGLNEGIDLTLAVPALAHPGRYRLQVEMVGEQHCYFHQAGSEPLEQELDVR
jgi:protein tyrosine phosphatase (PTP) superfamily phosphohydrolase (DUF442 family)